MLGNKTISMTQKVCNLMRSRILSGEFAVGSYLPPEDTLVKVLGASRASLREGIKQMEALGWLFIERGVGTRVTQPDFRVIEPCLEYLSHFGIVDTSDVHELRSLIEIQAVAAAASARDQNLVNALRSINQEILDNRVQANAFIDADIKFHNLIIETCPNKIFGLLLQGLQNFLTINLLDINSKPEDVTLVVQQHENIIQAIDQGDTEGARALMSEHLKIEEAATIVESFDETFGETLV